MDTLSTDIIITILGHITSMKDRINFMNYLMSSARMNELIKDLPHIANVDVIGFVYDEEEDTLEDIECGVAFEDEDGEFTGGLITYNYDRELFTQTCVRYVDALLDDANLSRPFVEQEKER